MKTIKICDKEYDIDCNALTFLQFKKVTDFYDIIVVPGPNVSNDNNFNHGYCFYSDDNYNGDEFIKMYFFEKMAGTSAENGIKKVTI